jgi:hypothetical protein
MSLAQHKTALDAGDSAAFFDSFLASGFSCCQAESPPHCPLAQTVWGTILYSCSTKVIQDMYLALIINSIVCVLGIVIGLLFAGASIVSIANMNVPWSNWLVMAALLIPIMFAVSGIGTWIAYARHIPRLTIGLIALPWLYAVVFVGFMLISFQL